MTTVLIVDEAHHLSSEILEEVRLLSNLETTNDKLLQIVLVGQPELDEKLDSFELRQLKQRIAVRTQLGPLDLAETKRYIERRLQIAAGGSDPGSIFPEATVVEVQRHSRGLPRLINTISENALMAAYAKRLQIVTPDIIEYVARELRLDVVPSPKAKASIGSSELDVKRAIGLLLDLYSALRRPMPSNGDTGSQVPVEVSEHEPYI